MGLTLPSELTEPLGWIGLVWPEADEDLLLEAGQRWIDVAERLQAQAATADRAAEQVWTDNRGESADQFRSWWTGEDGPHRRLSEDAQAAFLIGSALIVFAGITLALKLAFIAQLAILAFEVGQAIATAVVSFGATTAEIPGFIALTRMVCRELLDKAVQLVEREIAHLFEQAAKLLKKVGAKDLTRGAERMAERFGQKSAFHGLMREVEHADVASPVDGARFYSGRAPDGTRMRTFAEKGSDGVTTTTLEQTPGGKYLDDKQLYEPGSPVSKAQADQLWGRLSERYAQDAKGEVTAFSHDPWDGSVWVTRERPALEQNPDVTKITVIDPVP